MHCATANINSSIAKMTQRSRDKAFVGQNNNVVYHHIIVVLLFPNYRRVVEREREGFKAFSAGPEPVGGCQYQSVNCSALLWSEEEGRKDSFAGRLDGKQSAY